MAWLDLKGLVGLSGLFLAGTSITQTLDLSTWGNCRTGLKRLNLDKTKVTDARLTHLRGLAGLNELRLNGTKAHRRRKLQVFRRDMPGVKVIHSVQVRPQCKV